MKILLIFVFLIINLTSCQTVAKKIDEKVSEEEAQLSKWLNKSEVELKIEFGKPVGGPIVKSGLHFKVPLIQTVIKFDKRVLEWDGIANEIPTKDNKYILIDTFARWKISNALEFYKSAKNEVLAQSLLDDILDGAIRDEVANRTMVEIVRSTDRSMDIEEVDISKINKNEIPKDLSTSGARFKIIGNMIQ